MTIQFERSVTRDDLTALLDRRTPGYSLEAPLYTSPEVFDLDMSAIFAEPLDLRDHGGGAARAR